MFALVLLTDFKNCSVRCGLLQTLGSLPRKDPSMVHKSLIMTYKNKDQRLKALGRKHAPDSRKEKENARGTEVLQACKS